MATLLSGGSITAIMARILSVLSADLGTYDLSGTGAVRFGRFPEAPFMPFLALDPETLDSDDQAAELGRYEHRARVYVQGWCAHTVGTTQVQTDTPLSAFLGEWAFSNEVHDAIHDDFKSGGAGSLKALGLRRCNFPQTTWRRTEISGQNAAQFTCYLEFTYATTRGI